MTQNRARVIGITGGIATGKSTVSKLLIDEGFLLIDSDFVARDVVKVDREGYKKVIESFGEDILNEDKTLNRSKMASIIFNDDNKRNRLNNLLHPIITRTINNIVKSNMNTQKVIFIDMPLLFEVREKLEKAGLYFDEVWLVYTKEEVQLERLISRDKISSKDAIARIKAQLEIEKKKELADVIIDNQGSLNQLKVKILNLTLKYR